MDIPAGLARIPANTAKGFKLVAADDPRVMEAGNAKGQEVPLKGQQEEVTPESVSDWTKADCVDVLEGHGIEFDKRLGVAKLRDLVRDVVFVGA